MTDEELRALFQGIIAENRDHPPKSANPICNTCKHRPKGAVTCRAFPQGIPKDILFRRADHTKPYPGDNGIQYEKME